jgi:hypothetical protein
MAGKPAHFCIRANQKPFRLGWGCRPSSLSYWLSCSFHGFLSFLFFSFEIIGIDTHLQFKNLTGGMFGKGKQFIGT